jgi:hypothetical protein
MMNAHFSAAVPNLRIKETDIDRLAWDHELFTHMPEFADGYLMMPARLGHRAQRRSACHASAKGRRRIAERWPQTLIHDVAALGANYQPRNLTDSAAKARSAASHLKSP